MSYQLNYDKETGKVISISQCNMSIPLCEANTDYQDFLKWNSEQETPLDLNSTIPIPPLTADQLPKSTISAIVKSIASDKLSCIVTRTYQGINYDFKTLLTKLTADKLGKTPGIQVGATVIVTYIDHAPVGTLPIIVDAISPIIYP